MTGFYMEWNTGMKWVDVLEDKHCVKNGAFLVRIFSHSDQKNSEYGHFSHSESYQDEEFVKKTQ